MPDIFKENIEMTKNHNNHHNANHGHHEAGHSCECGGHGTGSSNSCCSANNKIFESEKVKAKINEVIAQIKSAHENEEITKHVETRINSMPMPEEKKGMLKTNALALMKSMTMAINEEVVKKQITATIGEEKTKTITEDNLIAEIDKFVENFKGAKLQETIDKYLVMLASGMMQKENAETHHDQPAVNEAEAAKAKQADANAPKTVSIEEYNKQKDMAMEYLGSLQRMKADFENYKRRVIKEKEDYKALAFEGIFSDLLSVLDSFNAITPEAKIDFEGMQKINKLLFNIMNKHSFNEIPTDATFDPNMHQALTTEVRDDVEENTILETIRKGYKLGEKVIRPALVKVSVRGQSETAENA